MTPFKTVFVWIALLCAGCAPTVEHRYCNGRWEGIPPENADEDILRIFKDCSPEKGVFLNDSTRRYYAAYAETRRPQYDYERKARKTVTEKIRADITGKKSANIPLYDLKLFKHFIYENDVVSYWGIYFIPEMEYKALRKKYRKK